MPGVVIVDTDVLIDVGRNIDQAIEFLEHLETQSKVAISVITQMELIVGCQSKQEQRILDKFLGRFDIVQLDEHISTVAVKLLRDYRLSHGLMIADALIAATAINLNSQLVSKNQKDYRFIKELALSTYP
jgi:predicted nucleic acid-binding protein